MMKRLILTNDSSAAGNVGLARLADFLVALERRFIWGPSPSDAELAAFFGARKRRPHWLDYSAQWRLESTGSMSLGLIELCARFDTIELWIDPWTHPFDVFPGHEKPNTRRVFDYWEAGELLDRLARGPAPAVSGLEEGPFTLEMHDNRSRHQRYKQSMLSLTSLGEAILAGRENFSRHNPIHRWWGGTELTNGSLWRWDPDRGELVAP